ncbi:MAG TPA: hypothetical protein VEK84_12795 [Terriglobales bacterium]|nr:hypothetical protein [Terriglobales bacterium]
MAPPPIPRRFDRDALRVAAIASAVSLLSLLYYFQHGQILLYGDAVAHINIARRVFDSQTPGLLQLGTVWLPLPHLLMIPLLVSDSLWQSGLAGSIPSMIAYVLGAVGVFRLARSLVASDVGNGSAARVSAWVAAFVYAANPNLIYLQTTAMTEPLYLALFVGAAVYFAESVRALRNNPPEDAVQVGAMLLRCGLCLVAAELTRYDGWFLAATAGAIVSVLAIQGWRERGFRSAMKFLVIIAAAPLIWLAYNAAVYGNTLEFANGPYSGKGIRQRSAALNPADNHVAVAASYFLKSAELNMAPGNWGRLWLAATAAALGFALWRLRALVPTFLLLCVPIVFYGFSIAHGGVPLYVPTWWPFTWYNIRYGLQLLPLFSVSAGILSAALLTAGKRLGPGLAVAALAVAVLSYASVWRVQPLCFKEAWVNSQTRVVLESTVERTIAAVPPNSRFLMYLGDHVGIFQQAGIPLRQVVNEGNHRPWQKPSDPSGLWERALANPPQYADYVIAFDGDAVDRAVDRSHLTLLNEIHSTGQPLARIYATKPGAR